MAKRVRGSSRPGQRRPVARRPAAPGTRPPADAAGTATPATAGASTASPSGGGSRPTGLTDAELERAAQLEAQMLAEEKAADASRRRSQERMTVAREGAGARAIQPEVEYAYVARDLRDIAKIAAILFAVLFVLWILIDVMGVFRIV